jgi:hypothetical protein
MRSAANGCACARLRRARCGIRAGPALAVQRRQALAHLRQAEALAAWSRPWPTPVSRTSSSSWPPSTAHDHVMRPPSTLGSSPCWMLFSTSGCSSSVGTFARRQRPAGRCRSYVQALAHADGHQLQVVAQAVELGLQRMRGAARRVERGAQVGDHVVQHLLRPRRIDRDQHAQVGQRVEQHVRLELRSSSFRRASLAWRCASPILRSR